MHQLMLRVKDLILLMVEDEEREEKEELDDGAKGNILRLFDFEGKKHRCIQKTNV
jgi:hypothetical protein